MKLKNIYLAILTLCLTIFLGSCGESEKPISKDKESFLGIWKSPSGFELQIMPEGKAIINQNINDKGFDFENLNINVAPSHITNLNVHFKEDSILTLNRPGYYARVYKIDKTPYLDSGRYKMVLNGVTLTK